MEALGMIETRGLVALIEASDAMALSARSAISRRMVMAETPNSLDNAVIFYESQI